VTAFVNGIDGTPSSWVAEFALSLAPESLLGGGDGGAGPPTDAAFATTYALRACPFAADAQGGARAIGRGVWLVASGTALEGLVCVDEAGGSSAWPFAANFYDPFTYITVA